MSLVTVSKKRNRHYTRQFDHDECRALRAEDPKLWTYARLAEHFGVTESAIQRVCRPGLAARMSAKSLEAARRSRRPCLGGCGKLVWHPQSRSGYCAVCLALKNNPNVRETELRCTKCGEWKPDEDFHRHRKKGVTRRGRKTFCKACDHAARAAYRDRHRAAEAAYSNRRYHAVSKHLRKEQRGTMAEYVVLRYEGEGRYEEVSRVEAVTPTLAIEAAVDSEGQYVGVLASRFELLPVEPKTVMKVVA